MAGVDASPDATNTSNPVRDWAETAMTRRRFIEEASGEEYVHKAVWQVVKRQLAHAEANPKKALLDDLVAMVFTSHALEGYANFLGQKVAPDLWKDERERFKETGLFGKLAALHERCGLEALKEGRRPHSTIQELKRLRNGIAHPKTRATVSRKEYAEGKEPPMPPMSYLEEVVSHERAIRAMQDVKEVVGRLHAAAVVRFPDKGLGPDGLDGIMGMRSTSAWLKE